MTAVDREPAAAAPPPEPPPEPPLEPQGRRPLVERIGMAAIAAVLATLFGVVAAISLASGEAFLAVMAATGALMTLWAGIRTLARG